MGEVVKVEFPKYFRAGRHADLANDSPSAIDTVKAEWNRQVDAMRAGVQYTPRSYEDVLVMSIKLRRWRAEGYKDSGDPETALHENIFADALQKALDEYREWVL